MNAWKHHLIGGAALAALLVLLTASVALAQGQEPVTAPGPHGFNVLVEPAQVNADDGGAWELGVEGTAGNLTQATAAERAGMWAWLNGWFVRRFSFDENSAWEEDFKRASRGGTENSWLDTVDLMFYVGHGSPGRFTFDNNTHDDGALDASIDCNTSWGDGDNEWLALTSCQVLADSGLGAMAQCMNRQHLILGFVTNASAHNNYWDTQAYHFGRYLRYGYNMTSAWFNACDIAQRDRVARVIAEESACFNDNPYWSSVCADSYDNDYYWWTHSCGTETATQIDLSTLAGELPVFQVAPYSLADATADFQRLGNAFTIPVTPTLQAAGMLTETVPQPPAPDNPTFLVATSASGGVTETLQMDKGSGLYQYTNQAALWNDATAQQILAANAAGIDQANAIDADIAIQIANSFLQQNGLFSDGAQVFEAITDGLGTLGKGQVAASAIGEAEVPTNWQVIYSRKLPVEVPTAAGATAQISMTVVGPGAKLKVYVPMSADPGAASVLQTDVIGAQGGWRDVLPLVDAASGDAVMTTILDEATIKALYAALDDEVTMNTLPMDIESAEVLSTTLAYWENVAGASQGQLIPVYELLVRITEAGTGAVTDDHLYVPASPEYMRPLARIIGAPTGKVANGTTLALEAADASKTLQENGIGNFNFVMGFDGASGDYLYRWFIGPATPDNTPVCTTRQCNLTVPYVYDDKDPVVDVTLVVIDSSSPNQSESTAAASLSLSPTVFLPAVEK